MERTLYTTTYAVLQVDRAGPSTPLAHPEINELGRGSLSVGEPRPRVRDRSNSDSKSKPCAVRPRTMARRAAEGALPPKMLANVRPARRAMRCER